MTNVVNRKHIEDHYPLSPLQEGLLFHSLYREDYGIYVTHFTCLMEGLDTGAFERAWQQAIDRHAILRTAFVWEGLAAPLQVVGSRVRLPLQHEDWSELAGDEQQRRLEDFLAGERARKFKFSRAPLLRLSLFRLSDRTHQFVFSHHHLLLDGWSLYLLFKEVFAFYGAFSAGSQLQLESPRPYRDYIAWLQRQDLSKAEAYWRETLAGFTSATSPGVDKAPGSLPSQKESHQDLRLSAKTMAALQSFARRHRLTLNTIAQGAWATLLSRYSGNQDVVFGATVSGRPAELAGVETMVGLFINTLPVRVHTPPAARLGSWLKALQDRQAEMRQYEYSHLSQVQAWSDVPAGSPLFESILDFENYPVDNSFKKDTDGLAIGEIRSEIKAGYPLILKVIPGSELLLDAMYDCRRFDDAAITRMLGHLQTILESMVTNPDQRLSDLAMLTQKERRQLLSQGTRDGVESSTDGSIHNLFEARVRAAPQAIAVVYEDETLTYEDLNRRANNLAHSLQALGVGPESLVGLYLERSTEMVVAILAVLKSGGAYLPLDPAYPAERLNFILEDSRAEVLLTQTKLAGDFSTESLKVVYLDRQLEVDAARKDQNPIAAVTGQNLAYVIYTSGSTGKPKGVQITHANVIRLFEATRRWFNFSREDVWTFFHSCAFDFSVWELWGALLYGGRIIVVPYWVSRSPEAFHKLLVEGAVTVLNQTPSAFRQLTQAEQTPGLEGKLALRLVIFGGEALELQYLDRWFERHGDDRPRLVNMYGITETTVHVTYRPVSIADVEMALGSVIGEGIADLDLYLLDERLEPVAIGLPGEIHVGGAGLARGYLDRPDLSAERFIPNPFAKQPGSRLYKSGDLARFLESGDIEYLGRLDEQVKIRGFRIELGEIESALAGHPAVSAACVLAREDEPGEKRLVAYVVENQHGIATVSDLRSYLAEELPEYMVPSSFVMLDAMPLTANGKIDRRALPVPDRTRPELEEAFAEPATPTTEILAAVWAEVLGIERVGTHDNFFELGGHSLLATSVLSRIRRTFDLDVPLSTIFETPTLAGLSERIDRAIRQRQGLTAPPLVRASRDGDLPLSFAQQRLWFLSQLESHSPVYNIAAAVRLKGEVEAEALERSLNEIIRRHESLRTGFVAVDGRPVQMIAPGAELKLERCDLTHMHSQQREPEALRQARQQASLPFDLTIAPLLRAKLWRISDDESVLCLTMHHIISDGWSLGVLIAELTAAYDAFVRGNNPALPEPKIQYADYAKWQRDWLQGHNLDSLLSYWKRTLEGAPGTIDLPTDFPRGRVQSFNGRVRSVLLSPPDSTSSLRVMSHREGVTLFMLLLAAFKVLLHRYTGQDDISVGTPVAGRSHVEIEGAIGCFVNTLVMRADLSGDPAFRDLLGRVRKMAVGAYAHQDLPFEQVVEALQPERTLSYNPLFQVMFILQNTPMPEAELPGLAVTSLPVDNGTSMFDLTLSIADTKRGLVASLWYDTDLFEDETINRVLGHYQNILNGILADPTQRLSSIAILTGAEQRQLLSDWNATEKTYPEVECIQQLFERQAERTPEAIAVVSGQQRLAYRELNARANQLANYLRELGVKSETRIGILVERSARMVVGLLGILKAGGAYVPLDPLYPKQRLEFILEDTNTMLLLTEQRMIENLPEHTAFVIRLDADWDEISTRSEQLPSAQVSASNLAYVIYTSGSTGIPKGVAIEHRSAVAFLHWALEFFDKEWLSGVLASTSICFDLSVFELFAPLSMGGKVIIAGSALELPAIDAAGEVTLINTVPSAARELMRMGDLPPRVRVVNLAGEALHNSLAQLIYRQPNVASVFNLYGPSEDTTYSTYEQVSKRGADNVPIGRPIANTQVYLLDRHQYPVPVGVSGEICVGGEGLARCYLNRPDLTAEKFIPNPYGKSPGARLYKTGDLARYLVNGSIEFLGRLDHQVKIRGFRIELGEIEATLAQHPSIQDVVVTSTENVSGERRLGAYLVSNQPAPSIGELRSFIGERLPDYMIPSAFIFLVALPLTSNGKIDRSALPAPGDQRPALEVSPIAPRTSVEELLVNIWSQVLRIKQIGIHDKFFELGGDSILSIQVVALANQAGLRLIPKDLFQHQTIAELATVASSLPSSDAEQGLVTGIVPLTPIQHWFFEEDRPEPHHYNQAVLLQAPQPIEGPVLESVFSHILHHHDALRLRFVKDLSGWRQFNAGVDDVVPFALLDLSGLNQDEQVRTIEQTAADLQTRLNFIDGPLMRAALFDLGPEKPARLFIVVHHLAIDGVSWRILLEDIQTACRQASRGKAIQLPPKTDSFKKWAERLYEYAQSEQLQREAYFWLTESRSQVCCLPLDYPDGLNAEASERTVSASLSADETRMLLQEVPSAHHAQINEVLLTGLVEAFARWSGGRSLLLDLEGHGREETGERLDLSRTVGWFTTIFPVFLDLSGSEDAASNLKSIKEQLRSVPNRGMSFGLLRYLNRSSDIAERLRDLPQAQVSFNYLGQFDQVLNEASIFAPCEESSGRARSRRGERKYLFDVSAMVSGGKLRVAVNYSENLHRSESVRQLAESFLQSLRALIDCPFAEAAGYIPSDFPQMEFGQKELDALIADLSESAEGQQ